MAIKLAPAVFLSVAKITILDEAGEPITIACKGRFKRLPKSQREELDKRVNKRVWGALAEDRQSPFMKEQLAGPLKRIKPIAGDSDLLDQVLVGWHLKDLDGNDIEYSEATRAECFDQLDGLEAALVNAYYAGRGLQDTPAKN